MKILLITICVILEFLLCAIAFKAGIVILGIGLVVFATIAQIAEYQGKSDE